MIDALADICRNNLYTNKLLLVPSYTVGQNIIRTLADKAPVLNLKIETIGGTIKQTQVYVYFKKGNDFYKIMGAYFSNDEEAKSDLFSFLELIEIK
jgi:hypothetical protein